MARKPKAEGAKADPPLISLNGGVDEFGRPLQDDEPERASGYNAADEKKVEAARKEAGQHKRQDADLYRIMMSTPERRASFYRLLERAHIYATAADLGGGAQLSDPYRTYFKLGEENVGKQMMLAAMDASTDLYLRMLKEQKELRDEKERKNESS